MRKPILISAILGSLFAFGQARAEELSSLEAVSVETLEKANGREGLSLNVAELESSHGFNQANGAIAGNATIGAGALSNVHGVAAVVMNTGHNAVVQVSQQIIFNLQ